MIAVFPANVYIAHYNVGGLHTSVPAGLLIGSGGPVTFTAPAGNTALSDQQNFAGSAPYGLVLQLQVDVLTAGGTNKFALNGSLQIVEAVPAPMGLMLVLSGTPVLGIAAWIRRRTKTAIVVA